MQLLSNISTWPAQRWPWLLLGTSALVLELIALYFQYGMGLEPCVMCIYQRTAVLGVAVAGYIGAVAPQKLIVRLAAYVLWFVSAIWGLLLAYEHVQMQDPQNFLLAMACDVYPDFPSWFAIHEWFPAVFEARGTCGDIDWQFLGQSMPSWMVVCFAIFTGAAALVLTSSLVKNKTI